MKRLQTSYIQKHKTALGIAALAALLAAVFTASLCIGPAGVCPADVAAVLWGGQRDTLAARIVLYTRLPRACAAMAAGAALAVSGTVLQTVLANPLAAPNIIGVNASAGLAVTLLGALAPGLARYTPAFAFFGALAGVALIVLLASRTGASRLTVALAGVALSSLFGATIDAVITLAPDALNGYTDFRIGGVSGATLARIGPACGVIGAALVLTLALSRSLDVLALGSETARSLGLSVRRVQAAALVLAAALAGAAVSFAGLLGFVGLIVPHIMRRLTGGETGPQVLANALGGAAFVLLCDLIARTLFVPYELSVGIVLAFTGTPFFLWLLLHQRKGRVHD